MDFDNLDLQPTPSYDDEIDLFQLVETIWDGKWLIVAITAFFALGGVTAIKLMPTEHNGSVQIVPQSQAIVAEYTGLNAVLSSARDAHDARDARDARDASDVPGPVITAESLANDFNREFNDLNEVRAVLEQTSSKLAAFEGTKRERSQFLAGLARAYAVKAPGKNQAFSMLSYSRLNEDEAREVLEASLEKVFASVGRENHKRLVNLKNSLEVQIQTELESVEQEVAALIRTARFSSQARMAFLREQASIARELNIAEGATETFVNASADPKSLQATAEIPFYLRGYRAIEKELEILSGRSDDQLQYHIPELAELLQYKAVLEADPRVQQLDRLIEQIPLLSPEFRPVLIDLDLMEVTSAKKSMLILALSIVVGGMVAVLFVLIRSGYKNYQARKSST